MTNAKINCAFSRIVHFSQLKSFRTSTALILTILMLMLAAAAPAATAQNFTLLHTFDVTDGSNSFAGLIQGTDGNLYGTTVQGGATGGGVVFRITPSGAFTTLYSFCSQSGCPDGSALWGGLFQGTDGNLYGTTYAGGANNSCIGGGCGTVFKLTTKGALTTLYSFCSQPGCTDGSIPFAPPIQATDGNFYGTTVTGGIDPNNFCKVNGSPGCGTVFKITSTGVFTTLYTFCSKNNCGDGTNPMAALLQAADGNFYGTTSGGGAHARGTVFKITSSGVFTRLYSFCSAASCVDGFGPVQPLIQASDGNLYGVTSSGGSSNQGTVFKITASGKLTTLYSFCSVSGCIDGREPRGLVQATDGNFYGASLYGGANDDGTLFKITPTGTLTTLYNFCSQSSCGDGANPYPILVQDTNGSFYGTTGFSGADGAGTIFRLSVGLGPFVETQTTSGKVGTNVKILGTNLTGATGVSFNGTAATFTLISNSLIKATVPTGATTGFVTVTTPHGTLTSNTEFHVAP